MLTPQLSDNPAGIRSGAVRHRATVEDHQVGVFSGGHHTMAGRRKSARQRIHFARVQATTDCHEANAHHQSIAAPARIVVIIRVRPMK
jgi:hypothetical protein